MGHIYKVFFGSGRFLCSRVGYRFCKGARAFEY